MVVEHMSLLEAALCESAIRQVAGPIAEHCDIHVFDDVSSTNSWLLEKGVSQKFGLCIAEHQLQGKGRRGREWKSEGGSFTCSIRVPLKVSPAQAGAFSLVAAISLRNALQALGVEGVRAKWPNDLLHQWRKLSGILLEVARSDHKSVDIVCGAGVNWHPLSEAVDQALIDVHSLCPGVQHNRNHLAGYWLAAMLEAVQRFEREGFQSFAAEWQACDLLHDAPVAVLRGNQRILGMARGVDNNGALCLETDKGIELMHAGEVSLRRQ
mgnify:CR=1 FL=1